jgi:hypothetical protein
MVYKPCFGQKEDALF